MVIYSAGKHFVPVLKSDIISVPFSILDFRFILTRRSHQNNHSDGFDILGIIKIILARSAPSFKGSRNLTKDWLCRQNAPLQQPEIRLLMYSLPPHIYKHTAL